MLEAAYTHTMDDGERRGVYKLFTAIERLGEIIVDDSDIDPDLYPPTPTK